MRGLALLATILGACGGPSPAPPPAVDPGEPARRTTWHSDVEIEYWVWAGDPARAPILLVAGMTGSAWSWMEPPEVLHTLRAGGRRVVAVSLRGRGGSSTPARGWHPDDHRDDLVAVLDAEHIERAHVVAHSVGVAYALELALDRPERVVSFVAGDYYPAFTRVTEAWVANVAGSAARFDRRMPALILADQVRWPETPVEVEAVPGQVERFGPDHREAIRALTIPVLVVLGTRSMPPSADAMWSGAPHGRVLRVDHGHDVFSHPGVQSAVAEHLRGGP